MSEETYKRYCQDYYIGKCYCIVRRTGDALNDDSVLFEDDVTREIAGKTGFSSGYYAKADGFLYERDALKALIRHAICRYRLSESQLKVAQKIMREHEYCYEVQKDWDRVDYISEAIVLKPMRRVLKGIEMSADEEPIFNEKGKPRKVFKKREGEGTAFLYVGRGLAYMSKALAMEAVRYPYSKECPDLKSMLGTPVCEELYLWQ